MRRLVNNWLYGEISPLLTGRLDTDIYAAGCSKLENMYVHRQGGISRRPPLKILEKIFVDIRTEANPTRIIPFTMSSNQAYLFFLVPWVDASHKFAIGIYNGTICRGIDASAFSGTPWGDLTENQLREIKYAQYYDSLYMVHKNCPLLRIRYTGVGTTSFVAELPTVKVNQDVKRYNVKLSISSWTTGSTGQYNVVVNGETHVVTRTSTTTLSDMYSSISALQYDGWTLTKLDDGVLFEADDEINKYVAWRLPTNATEQTDVSNYDFKITKVQSTDHYEFSYTFSAIEDTNETGLVYGQDDFLPMELNTQFNYASNIAVASERLWLVVNSNPCRVYVSRPYATSQLIMPKDSNYTILDFIQYEIVATTSKVMKAESELPVKPATDTNGATIYAGTAHDPRMWAYENAQAESDIKTKQDYDTAVESRECTVVMASLPDYQLTGETPYRRISSVTASDGSFTISYSYTPHISADYTANKIDTSKLRTEKDVNGIYYVFSYKYRYQNGQYYDFASANDSGTEGLKYHYFKTSDPWPTSGKNYFTAQNEASVVASPNPSDMGTYYERDVVFNPNVTVYEQNLVYVDQDSNIVDTEYNDVNGMVITFSYQGTVYCSALPYYIYDLSTDANVYEDSTEVDKVATSSTGMDLQFATGKNDYITWIGLGDSIMVGTESGEHRLEYSINPLDQKQDKYSDFGSTNGLVTNVGRDLIFLQKGNKLRLLYKDQWGLQNIEITLTNPDIMEGEILNMVGILNPEPALVILKRTSKIVDDTTVYTYSIVYVSLDRTNCIQAFSRWTFDWDIYDICVWENNGSQTLVVVGQDNGKYLSAYFDFNEKTTFADCGKVGLATRNGVHPYTSIMKALPFDTQTQDGSVTLGEAKNVSKIVFRCLDTGKVVTWYSDKDKNTSRTPICCDRNGDYIGGLADFAINVNGGTTRDLMIAVEAYQNEPMTLLAMAYELRVNRNG